MPYTVDFDPIKYRINFKVDGFFNNNEVELFVEEIRAIMDEIPESFTLLADMSNFKISSDRDSLIELQRHFESFEKLRAVAVVMPKSSIGSMQISRMSKESGVDTSVSRKEFQNIIDAKRWLDQVKIAT